MSSINALATRLFRRHDGKIENILRFGDLFELRGWSNFRTPQLGISNTLNTSTQPLATTESDRTDLLSSNQVRYEFRHVTVISNHPETRVRLLPAVRFQRQLSLAHVRTLTRDESLTHFTTQELKFALDNGAFNSSELMATDYTENSVHREVRRSVSNGADHVVISVAPKDSTFWNFQRALINFSNSITGVQTPLFLQIGSEIDRHDGAKYFSKAVPLDTKHLTALELGGFLIESLEVGEVTVIRPSIFVSNLALLNSEVRSLRRSIGAEKVICFYLGIQSEIAAISFRRTFDSVQMLYSPIEDWNLDWTLSKTSSDSVVYIEATSFLLGHHVRNQDTSLLSNFARFHPKDRTLR